ncbi:autoinducer 2 sensor kinase/phosphatase luxQ [Teratosphaeria destructans]|uniref:Autoinducer 2 sensor kinase/phosphatase luxQ n=1 Tax=Teratosphaeria destructans TaxID=418781 RepID=A0A9W7W5M0_9PEZI|nr:autoinducer 2 sensor kinase/phosphatase luxQ [Teratosphaeria destructans]
MSSIPPRPRHELHPDQQALHDHYRTTIAEVLTTDSTYTHHASDHPSIRGSTDPSDTIAGIFPFLAAVPSAGRLSLDLLRTLGAEMVRLKFPADARETAALFVMAYFKADFACYAHSEIAAKYDLLSAVQIEALREGREAEGLNEGCRLAVEMTRCLLERRGGLEGCLWEKCVAFFGQEGLVLLVHYVALFVWTSLAANVAGAVSPTLARENSESPAKNASDGLAHLPQGDAPRSWTDCIPTTDHNQIFLDCDYGRTTLGPIAQWGPALRIYASMVFADGRGAGVYWGRDKTAFYNEKFAATLGSKHPALMGRGLFEVFPEVEQMFGPICEKAAATRQTFEVNDVHLFLERNGYLEETFFVGQYIPLAGDSGEIEGFYNTVFESTQQRVEERRRRVVDNIAAIPTLSVKETLDKFGDALRSDPEDISAALIYSLDESVQGDADNLLLCASIGFPEGHPGAPQQLRFETSGEGFAPWFREVHLSRKPCVLKATDERYRALFVDVLWCGFGETPRELVIYPLAISGTFLGFYVQGTNPRRPFDEVAERGVTDLVNRMEVKWVNAITTEEAQLREQMLQQKLGDSESRLQHMAQNAPVGIQVNADRLISWANDQFYNITGHDRAKIGVVDFTSVLAHDEREKNLQWTEDLFNGSADSVREIRLQRHWTPPIKEDTEVEPSNAWMLVVCFPLIEDGEAKLLMGYVTDIRQVNNNQAAECPADVTLYCYSHQKWAENVQSRNAMLANLARRRQEEFIDITSHEMRNPLSAITQLADGIARSLETAHPETLQMWKSAAEESANAASTILACAAHQKRVIDDVLMLSRLESRILSIDPVIGQPSKVVADTIRMFDGETAMHDTTISVIRDESYDALEAAHLLIDVSRLTQILINLISNAIKFTSLQAKREIKVIYGQKNKRPNSLETAFGELQMVPSKVSSPYNAALPEFDDNQERMYLYFCVQDTGPGLSARSMEKLFERFSQASSTAKTHAKYGGSGLGLYIVRELSEKQGGGVGVSSKSGVGSVFAFYIETRIARAVDQEPESLILPSPDVPTASSTEQSTFFRPGAAVALPDMEVAGLAVPLLADPSCVFNILLVEDNLVNQKVLARQLEKANCRVHVANHGKEALEKLEQADCWQAAFNDHVTPTISTEALKIDIILMDIEMPVMNGLECTKCIRALEREKRISRRLPIMAVTANVRKEQQDVAFEAGVDGVLTKPFTVDGLLERIREAVRG